MCIASSISIQQCFWSTLESYSSSRILEFEQGDISPWFEGRQILHCDFSREKHDL